MAKLCGSVLLALLLSACGQAPDNSSRTFFESIPSELATAGPQAWLDVFEDSSSFFMLSDGAVAFPNRAAAEQFLSDFGPRVEVMTLAWLHPRYEDISDTVVAVTSPYEETIAMKDGSVSTFSGQVSGLMRRKDGQWRLQHLHWSSPRTTLEGTE